MTEELLDSIERVFLGQISGSIPQEFAICDVSGVGEVTMTRGAINVDGRPANALEMEKIRDFFAPLRS